MSTTTAPTVLTNAQTTEARLCAQLDDVTATLNGVGNDLAAAAARMQTAASGAVSRLGASMALAQAALAGVGTVAGQLASFADAIEADLAALRRLEAPAQPPEPPLGVPAPSQNGQHKALDQVAPTQEELEAEGDDWKKEMEAIEKEEKAQQQAESAPAVATVASPDPAVWSIVEEDECETCLGYGHINDETGQPTVDRLAPKCLDCRGRGKVLARPEEDMEGDPVATVASPDKKKPHKKGGDRRKKRG